MRYLFLFLFASFLFLHSHAYSEELQTIDPTILSWHTFEAPPLMITKGDKKGTGIVDGVRKLMQQEINDYTHREKTLPYKRFLLYAKQKLNICTAYLFKTPEREKYLLFSDPAVVFPGYEVILHKDTYEKLGFPDSVSIKELFEKQRFLMATNKIRAYSPKIDPIIAKHEKQNLVSRSSGSTTLVFRLLATKRADFMIDFPNRILFWTHELELDANDYFSIPIREDYKNAISYIACPKTDWGASVIDKVNQVLKDNVRTDTYLQILQRWSPEYHKAEIKELHQKYFLK